jgi:hypothetical protein
MRLYFALPMNRPSTDGIAAGCQSSHVGGLGLGRFWKADTVT